MNLSSKKTQAWQIFQIINSETGDRSLKSQLLSSLYYYKAKGADRHFHSSLTTCTAGYPVCVVVLFNCNSI